MRDFRKIKAWALADDLAVAVYDVSKSFPREEIYGITSQIRRAASSVAANIVEGASRESAKDYAHFLQIARGSLAGRDVQRGRMPNAARRWVLIPATSYLPWATPRAASE